MVYCIYRSTNENESIRKFFLSNAVLLLTTRTISCSISLKVFVGHLVLREQHGSWASKYSTKKYEGENFCWQDATLLVEFHCKLLLAESFSNIGIVTWLVSH